ncbi:hypothetical protein [Kordia jejudonensis]|uniref:hypothetical protein n=1 Tax=Kordia jejudonensis TaxID=1348245 RepID=UPI0012E0A28B|nr:hypothetical protein [Kordia jejudonensis]
MILSLTSCENEDNSVQHETTVHTHEIVSTLIDKFSKPIPIPPKTTDSYDNPITRNSTKIISVGLKQIMQPISLENSAKINDILSEIDTTFKIKFGQKEEILTIELQKLQKEGNYTTRYINEEKDIFNSIDILYNLSTIHFNDDYSKAVVIMGMSRGKLSGFADIIVLERVDRKWLIIKRENLHIS